MTGETFRGPRQKTPAGEVDDRKAVHVQERRGGTDASRQFSQLLKVVFQIEQHLIESSGLLSHGAQSMTAVGRVLTEVGKRAKVP